MELEWDGGLKKANTRPRRIIIHPKRKPKLLVLFIISSSIKDKLEVRSTVIIVIKTEITKLKPDISKHPFKMSSLIDCKILIITISFSMFLEDTPIELVIVRVAPILHELFPIFSWFLRSTPQKSIQISTSDPPNCVENLKEFEI